MGNVLGALILMATLCVACEGKGPSAASQPNHATPTPSAPVAGDLPACDDDQSYGRTIPGRWLEDVILTLGAPGGHEVTNKEVGDTGTALSINIPQYDNDPTIYATMLTPGDDPNITSSPLEEEVGKHGSYSSIYKMATPGRVTRRSARAGNSRSSPTPVPTMTRSPGQMAPLSG